MTPDPKTASWMTNGPTLEQRMSGFAWFGDIYEAKDWDPSKEKVDVLQRANTPLLRRATPVDPNRTKKVDSPPSPTPMSPLLLMTDYNTYSPHEATQGVIRPEEEYFVQFWQHVDVFCYFVHRHITIPPPTWINSGHRNGAQVLGMLIFEGKDHIDHQTAAMLEKVGDKYWLADKLANMAGYYGFDGWLLNMEAYIDNPDKNGWRNGVAMEEFIGQLKTGLANYGVPNGGKVIWYDSLVASNTLSYQYTLNDYNLAFSKKAGSITTDYDTQTDQTAMTAGNTAVANGMTRDNVYMGRIIHATMTNAPYLAPMAKYGVGSGLFATGWCFQKFKPPPDKSTLDMKTYRSDADRYMWTGDPDLKDLADLKNAGVFGEAGSVDETKPPVNALDTYINKDSQTEKCITKYAKSFPAGSDAFFYTNYGTAVDYHGPQQYAAHLNEQSIWPSQKSALLTTPNSTTGRIITKLAGSHAPCAIAIVIGSVITPDATQVDGYISLHKVNMRPDLHLSLSLTYKRSAEAPKDLKILAWADAGSQRLQWDLTGEKDTETKQVLSFGNVHDHITEIGIHLQGPMSLFEAKKRYHVLDVMEMLVKPKQEDYAACNVQNIAVVQDGEPSLPSPKLYSRINWDVSPLLKEGQRPTYLPYSSVTGPFSYFDVAVGNKYVGRAHTLAFVLDQDAVKRYNLIAGATVEISIRAVAFDGTVHGPFKQNVTWI